VAAGYRSQGPIARNSPRAAGSEALVAAGYHSQGPIARNSPQPQGLTPLAAADTVRRAAMLATVHSLPQLGQMGIPFTPVTPSDRPLSPNPGQTSPYEPRRCLNLSLQTTDNLGLGV